MMSAHPLVSIGFPVFNGAAHVRAALESLTRQDYPSFEIIVCDNCSTDETYEICCEAAKRDSRIRVLRNEVNEGAVNNFNKVLFAATGKFFMWAAHDDTRAPEYLKTCVAALEQNPKAAVAQSKVHFVDERGESLNITIENPIANDARPVERLDAALNTQWWTQVIYGLFRREHLTRHGGFSHLVAGDRLLVAQVALDAPVMQVPQSLFDYRVDRHQTKQPLESQPWYRAARTRKAGRYFSFPLAETFAAYLAAVRASSLTFGEKLRAVGLVSQWYFVEMKLLPMAAKLRRHISLPDPLYRGLRRAVHALRNDLTGSNTPVD